MENEEEDGDEEGEDEDDYYDEEIDDEEDENGDEEEDPEEVQIYIGRNPELMERLSHNEMMHHHAPGGALRREDIMSMNNMSMDMFNIGGGARGNIYQHHHHAIDEGASADFSQD